MKQIYFITPFEKKPVGGIKQIYRQVDVLNKFGFEAYVVHKNRGQRCKWFDNQTKIIYNYKIFNQIYNSKSKKLKKIIKKKSDDLISENGILVIPEVLASNIFNLTFKNNYVIFNQNCYYTFNGFDNPSSKFYNPYTSTRCLGVMVVSEDSKQYLEYCYKEKKIHKITLGVDFEKFSFSKNKSKQISFMPRKLTEDSFQVINMLNLVLKDKNWIFTPIDNLSENEVAQVLKNTAIFLSFNHREGFGLPPLEALSCGCIVVGYTGQGGKEYFDITNSYQIESGNIISFVKKVKVITEELSKNESKYNELNKKNSKLVTDNFSYEKEELSILDFWENLN